MSDPSAYRELVEAPIEWVDVLPKGWTSSRLQRVAAIFAGGTPDRSNPEFWLNGEVPWLNSGSVNDRIIVSPSELITLAAATGSNTRWAHAGSVLVALAGQGKTKGMAARLELSSTFNQSMAAIVPNRELLDYRYLELWLGSNYRRIRNMAGGDLRDGLNLQHIGSIPVPLPGIEEQQKIVEYSDRETAEIDAFIADQEELIGLLAERRDGAWQEAVDSLNAPEVRLRRVIENIADGPFGSSLTSSHYADSGARVVRLGNIGINVFKDDDRVFISMEYFEDLKAHEIRAGEVVVAGLGDEKMPLGRAAVVPSIGRAIVKADCYRVRPGPLVTSEYLAWVLSAPQTRARLRLLARGSTRQRLNTAVVRDVEIPLPTLAAQGSILEISKTAVETMDLAIADAKEAIALSRERRAALISAAVTGKIDGREHGAVA